VSGYWSKSVAGVVSILSARRIDNTNKIISRPDFIFDNAFTFVTDTATYLAYSVLEKNDTAKTLQGSYTTFYSNVEHNNTDSVNLTTTSKKRDLIITATNWSYTETIIKTVKARLTGLDVVPPVQTVNSSQGTWSQDDIRSGKYVFVTQDLKSKNRIFLISSLEKLYKKK
jgi:hypothetical protein